MPERPEFERMESFSNPMAPPEIMDESMEGDDHQPLSNADFRKMLMTPRNPKSGSAPSTSAPVRGDRNSTEANIEDDDDPAARRRKKKIYYAKLKRLEEERQKELAEKYRDRARERRDGNPDDVADTVSTTADYRAVAPDAKSIENLAERRKQVIQESKYLGGDMEHTHLVKGLDYALLEKVRAEISSKEREEEQEMEKAVTQAPKEKQKEEEPEEHIQFKTKMGRNIYRALFKPKENNRNELFLQGRMAYVVDLEDEFADSDVPTTIIRSKADCPSLEVSTTLTTNDIVINKLTQILSYLRQGRRESKKLKKLKGKLREQEKLQIKAPGAEDNIYADLTDYVPSVGKSKDKKDRGKDRDRDRRDKDRDRDRRDHDRDRDRDRRDRDRDRDRGRSDRGRDDRDDRKRKSYFEKPVEEDEDRSRTNANVKELVKTVTDRYRGYAEMEEEKERNAAKKEQERIKKLKQKTEIDSYAECYPGMEEAADAVDDSDDEVDYTKMDQGNKKGPVGRWDFDTQEEYSDYMANKEALPKAAFQYGVKMSDGRKTRRAGPKDEKAEFDRQWQQIQNIMNKRKGDDHRGDDRKKSKY